VAREADIVRAIEAQLHADIEARDAKAFLSHYAPDATLKLPGRPAVHLNVVGTEAMAANFSTMLSDPNYSMATSIDKVVVSASGDLAYMTGAATRTASLPDSSEITTSNLQFMLVFRRGAGGEWQIAEDFNSEILAP